MRAKLKIESALSMNNGIRFYSKRHRGYCAIATIDEQGIIATEWTTIKKCKKQKNKKEKKSEMKKILKLMLGILPFAIIFVILLRWLMIRNPIYGIRTFFLGYALMSLGRVLIAISIGKKQGESPYKFHSAEHMVINAYNELERVPTLEEIRKYSRFNNYCGTNVTTQIVMSCVLMFICSFIPNLLFALIAMILVDVLVLILLRCGCLNFLQKLTTIIPTDRELLVAIEGMNVWLENEKKEKKKKNLFIRLFPRVFN